MPSGNSPFFWVFLFAEILAFALAFHLACRAFAPLAVIWGLWDPPSGRKDHARPVLFSGGLAILFSFASAGAFLLLQKGGTRERAFVLLGVLLCGSVGLADDWRKSRGKDLAAHWKLLAQVSASICAIAGGIELRLFGEAAWNLGTTLLWLVAVQNAWNFLDNMDGLAAGLAGIAALCFAAIFTSLGASDLALLSGAIAGVCLGFFPINFPKARGYLGDAGTGCLGYSFGTLAVAGTYVLPEGPGLLAVTVPLSVLAIPLFDMAQVVAARILAGQPIYRGDHRHLSHRLAEKLGSRPQAVVTLIVSGLVLGTLSLFVPHATTGVAWGILGAQVTALAGILFFALR